MSTHIHGFAFVFVLYSLFFIFYYKNQKVGHLIGTKV